MPQSETRARPSAWWYLLTVGLWIASIVVFIIALKPIISIFSAGVDQVRNNSAVTIPSTGRTVYASDATADASCTLTDSSGKSTALDPWDDNDGNTTFTFSFDDGTEVKPLANTPKDFAAGSYTLKCKGVHGALLATGKRLDFDDFAGRLIIGVLVSFVAGIVGLVWLIVMLVRRHNSKVRIRNAQTAGAYGYGGYPPAAYPPGGYPQGSYPPQAQPYSPPAQPYSPPDASSPDAYGTPPTSGSGYGAPPTSDYGSPSTPDYGTPPPPPPGDGSPTDPPETRQ